MTIKIINPMSDKQTLSEVIAEFEKVYSDKINTELIYERGQKNILERILPKLKAIEQTPSGYCRWVGWSQPERRLKIGEWLKRQQEWTITELRNEYSVFYHVAPIVFIDLIDRFIAEESTSTIDARQVASDAIDQCEVSFGYFGGRNNDDYINWKEQYLNKLYDTERKDI